MTAAGQDKGRLEQQVANLLPTPTTQDAANNGGPSQLDRNTPPLNAAVTLLPSPSAADGSGAGRFNSEGHQKTLPGTAREIALLPTPAVNDMGDGKTLEWWDEWAPRQMSSDGKPAPHGKSLAIEAQRLLPTPTTTDALGARNSTCWRDPERRDGHPGDTLLDAFWKLEGVEDPKTTAEREAAGDALLPTPSAALGSGGQTSRSGDRKDEPLLAGLAQDATEGRFPTDELAEGDQPDSWGPYAPAIARWAAVLGRPAPDPTQPSKKGNPQLAAPFVEWMMGLPEGHVTDVPGTTRNDQLKALGNGVVPLQAAAALATMLAWELPA